MKNIWEELAKPILCLAPMEGVTDTVFRRVVIKAGRPDLMFTEFTSVDGLISKGFAYVAQRLEYTEAERPIIAQIWGNKPENFYQAAKMLASMGFDGIDINMGCPDRAVLRTGGGAALIEQPELARKIIQATREGVGALPISVKTRIGFKAVVTEAWVKWLLESQIEALIIHGRTAKELSKGKAHWEEIGKAMEIRNSIFGGSETRIVRARSLPPRRGPAARANSTSPAPPGTIIIGNGDVESREEAMEKVKQYGVDGVMIGRGALKNPWIFQKIPMPNAKCQKIQLLKYHMDLFEKTWQAKRPFVTLRKYFKIYARGFRGAVKLREALMTAETAVEVRRLLDL